MKRSCLAIALLALASFASQAGTIHGTAAITTDVPLYILEQADASADKDAYGQLWVNTATPNEPWFTDDTGTDERIILTGPTTVYTWCHTHGDVSGAPITAADHHYDYYRAPAAITVTEIWCTTDAGTFTMNVENVTTDIMGSDLACDAGGEVDSSPSGDTTVADGATLSMVATSAASTPHTVTWCVEYTRD